MKDYFRPGAGLSLEPARRGLGSGVREARGPRRATCSARAGGTRSALPGAHAGDPCRWESGAPPRAPAMVAKQRIRMANEKHSKNITQRGNVAKTLVSGGGGAARAERAGPGGAGRGGRGRGLRAPAARAPGSSAPGPPAGPAAGALRAGLRAWGTPRCSPGPWWVVTPLGVALGPPTRRGRASPGKNWVFVSGRRTESHTVTETVKASA